MEWSQFGMLCAMMFLIASYFVEDISKWIGLIVSAFFWMTLGMIGIFAEKKNKRMRKGISQLIAFIMLIVTSVFLAGFLYMLISPFIKAWNESLEAEKHNVCEYFCVSKGMEYLNYYGFNNRICVCESCEQFDLINNFTVCEIKPFRITEID